MKDFDDASTSITQKLPHPLIALLPILVLMALMALVVRLFGADALGGASQTALLTASGVCVLLSTIVCHTPWKSFSTAIRDTIGGGAEAIVILLVIGMLSGAWMISGTVPTLICYGVQIMSPRFFLFTTCIICSVVSVLTGSSWTTIATLGVALMGIGTVLGIPTAMTAGAIISGAYFGDKISPLSDTTVLAASTAGTDLFTHIRYMLGTTIPSMTICLIIFFILGFTVTPESGIDVAAYINGLKSTFHITPWTMVVPVLTAVLIARRAPALITLFISALIGGLAAIVLQPHILADIATTAGGNASFPLLKGFLVTLFGPTAIDTGNPLLNDLVSTGGMAGMTDTVWLILCALTFGSTMVAGGMLKSITLTLIRGIRSTVGLVGSTVATGLVMNLTCSDQYLSIILTCNMYKGVYHDKGYENRLLSRSTEDAVTVTSVLVPWNSCGMTQSAVLGIPTLIYLPFCFFNLLSPLMSVVMAAIGWRIHRNPTTQPTETGN